MDWLSLFSMWRKDYDFRTFLNSLGSLAVTVIFALYNGFIGIRYETHWHRSICIYYLLLVLIRGMIILTERKAKRHEGAETDRLRKLTYQVDSVLLLLLNICLIAPIAFLVRQEKPVNMTLIPAIAMALYSFLKITFASINLVKRKKSANCLVKLLRSINFIDALLSIANLQNTLILVATTEGDTMNMIPLTAASSALIWLAIVVLSVSGLIAGRRL